jgi:hypothetical protein
VSTPGTSAEVENYKRMALPELSACMGRVNIGVVKDDEMGEECCTHTRQKQYVESINMTA